MKDAGAGREALHIPEVMKVVREQGAHARSGPEGAGPTLPAPSWGTRALRGTAAVALATVVTAIGIRAASS
jgi:hypothetical protein